MPEPRLVTWKDAICPNCGGVRDWDLRSYGPGGSRGVWHCRLCEPRVTGVQPETKATT